MLYTVAEAARELGLKPSSVYALIGARELGHHRIGRGKRGGIMISCEQIRDYLAAHAVAPQQTRPAAPPRRVTLKHLKLEP